MSRSATAVGAAIAVMIVAAAAPARAEDEGPCVGRDARGTFAACFDPGNRLAVHVGTDGYGGGVDVRHTTEPEPGVKWRLEHEFVHVQIAADAVNGQLYAGRFLRHTNDGHIVLPFNPQRKLFVPFDIGGEAAVGELDRVIGSDALELGVIRAALMFELTRANHGRRRLGLGTQARWDMSLPDDISAIDEHRLGPFSTAVLDLYLESRSGLTLFRARAEAGSVWSNQEGWRREVEASATLERVLLALNDQPLSLFATGSYDRRVRGADMEWRGAVGLRVALVAAHPKRR